VTGSEPRPSPVLRIVAATPAADGALVLAFLDGDTAAFGELVRRHQEVAYRLARRFARTNDDAFDLTQKAFLQAFEHARRSVLKGGADFPFRVWLLRIVVNLGKNLVRDSRRWAAQPVESIDAEKSTDGGAQAELEAGEVFSLRVDAGLPFADIARTLDITENNAKTHFHHAVKRLRSEVLLLSGKDES
jgi:RNA polymerase sigma-70 factor, ECF subfamily